MLGEYSCTDAWLFNGKHQACDAVVQIGMAGFGAGLTWAGIVVQWQ